MSITDYEFLQSPDQIKWLVYSLPNYSKINYNSLRVQTQQINETTYILYLLGLYF